MQVQRYDWAEAGQSLREAYGPFDWFATADVEHSSNQTPTVSQFQSSGRRQTFVDLGVSQLLPTGGTYNIGINNSRTVTTGGGTLTFRLGGGTAAWEVAFLSSGCILK